jgi:hypothetical protein
VAEKLLETNLKEKPEEYKNCPVVVTVEECKAMMDEAMKD